MSRFKWGKENQILVAQGKEGSLWENGNAVFIGVSLRCDRWKVRRNAGFAEQASIVSYRVAGGAIETGGQTASGADEHDDERQLQLSEAC